LVPSVWSPLDGGGYSQGSEMRHNWMHRVVSMVQLQSTKIGSGELPIWLWDPGIHLVGRQLHFFMDSGFADLGFIELPLQVMSLVSKFVSYRYFSRGFHERRLQYEHVGQTVMIRVEKRQHDGPIQRLAWDLGLTGLISSMTVRDKMVLIGENHSDFPLGFRLEEGISLSSDSLSCGSTSLWRLHIQLEEAVHVFSRLWRPGSLFIRANHFCRSLLLGCMGLVP